MTIEGFYSDWRLYNDLIVEAFRGMPADELALKAASDDARSSTGWPIWAIAGHAAAMRVYWLSGVLGVPGADATPFGGMDDGWEDHLDQPRSADELVIAWITTWRIVENALRTWTPEMLDEPTSRETDGSGPRLTRQSILLRLIVHEAYHVGEIAVIQASDGRPPIDLWPPGYHTVEAAATRASGGQRRRPQ